MYSKFLSSHTAPSPIRKKRTSNRLNPKHIIKDPSVHDELKKSKNITTMWRGKQRIKYFFWYSIFLAIVTVMASNFFILIKEKFRPFNQSFQFPKLKWVAQQQDRGICWWWSTNLKLSLCNEQFASRFTCHSWRDLVLWSFQQWRIIESTQ